MAPHVLENTSPVHCIDQVCLQYIYIPVWYRFNILLFPTLSRWQKMLCNCYQTTKYLHSILRNSGQCFLFFHFFRFCFVNTVSVLNIVCFQGTLCKMCCRDSLETREWTLLSFCFSQCFCSLLPLIHFKSCTGYWTFLCCYFSTWAGFHQALSKQQSYRSFLAQHAPFCLRKLFCFIFFAESYLRRLKLAHAKWNYHQQPLSLA